MSKMLAVGRTCGCLALSDKQFLTSLRRWMVGVDIKISDCYERPQEKLSPHGSQYTYNYAVEKTKPKHYLILTMVMFTMYKNSQYSTTTVFLWARNLNIF